MAQCVIILFDHLSNGKETLFYLLSVNFPFTLFELYITRNDGDYRNMVSKKGKTFYA